MKISRLKWIGPLVLLVLLALFGGLAECAKKTSSSAASPVKAAAPPPSAEDASVIEEVSAKQLERLLQDKDYVAVYWCKCAGGEIQKSFEGKVSRERLENGSYIIQ